MVKKEYSALPASMAEMETYGFNWMEFVTAIPSPLFLVTTYKSNGKANACLESWSCFSGGKNGFYAILSAVNKSGHLYESVIEKKAAVINFPTADIYDRCLLTVSNNGFEQDEIVSAGLTSEKASTVDAPRIKECFMNLECRFLWEKEIAEGDDYVMMCLEIINICADENRLDENAKGRYGNEGFIYNIHHPIDPEKFSGKSRDSVGVLKKILNSEEY